MGTGAGPPYGHPLPPARASPAAVPPDQALPASLPVAKPALTAGAPPQVEVPAAAAALLAAAKAAPAAGSSFKDVQKDTPRLPGEGRKVWRGRVLAKVRSMRPPKPTGPAAAAAGPAGGRAAVGAPAAAHAGPPALPPAPAAAPRQQAAGPQLPPPPPAPTRRPDGGKGTASGGRARLRARQRPSPKGKGPGAKGMAAGPSSSRAVQLAVPGRAVPGGWPSVPRWAALGTASPSGSRCSTECFLVG